MASHLLVNIGSGKDHFNFKPLTELNQCWFVSLRNAVQWNLNQNENIFLKKYIWKFCLQNGAHFVQASMFYNVTVSISLLLICHMMMSWHERGFPCYWPFVRGIQCCLVDSPYKRPETLPLLFSSMLANRLLKKQMSCQWLRDVIFWILIFIYNITSGCWRHQVIIGSVGSQLRY